MINNQQLVLVLSLIGALCVAMLGCQEKIHPSRVGEYGEELIKNIYLRQKEIDKLNTTVPLPFNEASQLVNYPTAKIDFVGELGKNPYRYVMVIRGKALNSDKVTIGFTYEFMSTNLQTNSLLGLVKNEKSQKYSANEDVLMVIASEPFSLAPERAHGEYLMTAYLKQRDNIRIDSVELQIWQGKASKRSGFSYAMFSVFLLIGAGFVLRLMQLRVR